MKEAKQLKSILEEEIVAHQRLLDAKKAEQEQVVRGTIDDLVTALDSVRAAASEVERLEAARDSLCQDLAGKVGQDGQPATLHWLIDRLPSRQSEDLRALGEDLTGLVASLRRVNEDTAFVVRRSLEWITGTLASLSGEVSGAVLYDGLGSGSTSRPEGIILNRTA